MLVITTITDNKDNDDGNIFFVLPLALYIYCWQKLVAW